MTDDNAILSAEEISLLLKGFSARDKLIGQVQYGLMTWEHAEAEADATGVGPLARKPGRAEFDPLTSAWWSLSMSIIWIAWRSIDAVMEASTDYRHNSWEWAPVVFPSRHPGKVHRGHDLRRRSQATMLELLAHETVSQVQGSAIPGAYAINDAEGRLIQGLVAGMVEAQGRNARSGIRELISSLHWSYLKFTDEAGGSARCEGLMFLDVGFRRTDLFVRWPPRDMSSDPKQDWAPGRAQKKPLRSNRVGRPSNMPVIVREHLRRCREKLVKVGIGEESRELHSWFSLKYLDRRAPSPSTIESAIRKQHREFVTSGPRK